MVNKLTINKELNESDNDLRYIPDLKKTVKILEDKLQQQNDD